MGIVLDAVDVALPRANRVTLDQAELRAAIAAGEFAPYVQRFRGERATGTG